MKKSKIAIAGFVVLAAGGGTAWFYRRADAAAVPAYRTAAVTRTSLKSTVSATGTLQAVRTVQVGTQVSGQVAQIYVDFNDKVKKGQLLARIDPTLQQQAVQDAQAQLEKAQAQLTQAQDDYARNKALFDGRIITAQEFETSQANFSVQQSTLKSAQIALDRAKQQLSYTSIYAPIDGVIVERNVDVGQTVAASLSAPQLFLIANDLSEMQILASVDESDIGQIKDGQPVQFTVQSYPNQQFSGTVKQVRLQSTTADNVVNYTAVISTTNDKGNLLPGMTATVQFLTASANNVLTVPNAALRITPSAEMLKEAGVTPRTTSAGSATTRDSTTATARTGATRGARTTPPPAVWYVGADKKLHREKVTVGLSDGQKTAVQGPDLKEGTEIVIAVTTDPNATQASGAPAASNPFQPARGGPMGGAGGGRPAGR